MFTITSIVIVTLIKNVGKPTFIFTDFLHFILPFTITNELSLKNITQEDLNLVFSHINSTPRESLNGKTPYEIMEFLYGKELLDLLDIKQIKRDEVVLKPYLIKHIYKK